MENKHGCVILTQKEYNELVDKAESKETKVIITANLGVTVPIDDYMPQRQYFTTISTSDNFELSGVLVGKIKRLLNNLKGEFNATYKNYYIHEKNSKELLSALEAVSSERAEYLDELDRLKAEFDYVKSKWWYKLFYSWLNSQ